MVLYLCIEVPLVMGFDWWQSPKTLSYLDYCIDAWFWLDIILNFRTGFTHDGKVVMEPKLIIKHYLSFWFWIDIVSVLPFEGVSAIIMVSNSDAQKDTKLLRKMVKIVKWFKLPRLLRLGKVFRALKSYGKYANLVLCILTFVFLTHLSACFWVLIINPCEQVSDEIYTENPEGNLYKSDEYTGICSQASAAVYYTNAMHASMTMLMGGSVRNFDNDLMRVAWKQNPTTLHVASSVVMFLGATVTAMIFAYLTTIVVKTANASWGFFNRQASVKEQMSAMKLPHKLSYRVLRHYDYLWAQHLWVQSSFLDDPTVSSNLKRQIRLHIYKPYFKKSDLMSFLTDEIIMKFGAFFVPEICMPDEDIMRRGEHGDRMWLVTKGNVNIIHEIANETFQVRGGSIVGAYEMVDQGPRAHTVRAASIVELMVLSTQQFHAIMKDYPKALRKLRKKVAKRRSLEGNTHHILHHIQGLRYVKKSMDDFCLESIEEQIQMLASSVTDLTGPGSHGDVTPAYL